MHNVEGPVERGSLVLFEVVHYVVKDFAPEELPLLAGLRQFGEVDIGRRLGRGAKRDDPLGFGMGEVVALVTPVVWAAVQHVVDRMANSAADGLSSRIRIFFRKKLGRKASAAPLPHFGPAELEEVRSKVLELAMRGGMTRTRAELLAYKVVDRLRDANSSDGKA